jgi:anthranilate synthase component 2
MRALEPSAIVISPGPCTPDEAGISLEVFAALAGVCRSSACAWASGIGQAFGGKVVRARRRIMHGKTSPIHHDGRGVFAGLPDPFEATRYHSLVVEQASLPTCWKSRPGPRTPTAASTRSWACAIASLAVEGVQFHPESILTQHGHACCAISWTMACRAQPESALSKLRKTHADHSAAGAAALH